MRFTLQKIIPTNAVLAIGLAAWLAATARGPNAYSQEPEFNTENNAKAIASTEPRARAILFQEQNEEIEFCANLDQKEDGRGGYDLALNRTTGETISHSHFGYFDVTSTSSQPVAIRPTALEDIQPLLETGQFQLLLCRMASAKPSGLKAKPSDGPKNREELQITEVRPATITVGETVLFGKKREKVGFPEQECITVYDRDGLPHNRCSYVQHYKEVPGDQKVRGTANIPGVETWFAHLVDPYGEPIEEMRESCATWAGDQQTLASLAKQREVARARAEADALTQAKQETERKRSTAEKDALAAGGWDSLEEYLSHATEYADYRTKLVQLIQDYKYDYALFFDKKSSQPYRESPYFRQGAPAIVGRAGLGDHKHSIPYLNSVLAAFNQANGTPISSRGGATQLAAIAALTQVLAFAPEEQSDGDFLKLRRMAETGPNTFCEPSRPGGFADCQEESSVSLSFNLNQCRS